MIISIVVAASDDNAIGRDNQLLWKLPNDMKFFKNLTWGMPILMGRKTFESIGSKALPGRLNIVLTRQAEAIQQTKDIVIADNIEKAIGLASAANYKELFVIGGSDLYRQMMPTANKIYLTRVHAFYPDADSFIDQIDQNSFRLIVSENFPSDDRHAFSYSFETWERKQ
jgi:dihydrofolate reductase